MADAKSTQSPVARVPGSFTSDPTRNAAIKARGWGHLTKGILKIIASYSPILEVFAGSGYNAAILKREGVDVIATDIKKDAHYHGGWSNMKCSADVHTEDALESVRKHTGR